MNIFKTETAVSGEFIRGKIFHNSNGDKLVLTNILDKKPGIYAPFPQRELSKSSLDSLIEELQVISKKMGEVE